MSCIGGNFFRVKGQQSLQHTYGNSSVTPGTEPAYGWQGRSSPCATRSVSVTRPGWSRLPASCLETPETRAHTQPLGTRLLPAGGGGGGVHELLRRHGRQHRLILTHIPEVHFPIPDNFSTSFWISWQFQLVQVPLQEQAPQKLCLHCPEDLPAEKNPCPA